MPKLPAIRTSYSSLVYDPASARYRGPDGRYLSNADVRRRIDEDIDATKARMRSHAERAQRGEISVNEWRDLQRDEIKKLHLNNVAQARGGFHSLTQSDYGTAGQAIREQYDYLENRAKIVAGDPEYLASDRFLAVAESYGEAGRITYEGVKEKSDEAVGLLWSVNILDDEALHCKPKNGKQSCRQQSEKSPCLNAEMVGVGRRACGPSCRCNVDRYKTEAAALAAMGGTKRQLVPMEMYS